MKRFLPILAFLAGAALAQDKPVLLPATRREKLEIDALNARTRQLEQARREIDADTAEVVSGIRARLHLEESCRFHFDPESQGFVIDPPAAPSSAAAVTTR